MNGTHPPPRVKSNSRLMRDVSTIMLPGSTMRAAYAKSGESLCRALSPPRKRNLVAVVLSELSFLRAGMASLPKSELDELTRMPKPTGYGIRPHACAHISYSVHNPTCYYTPRTVHYYKYTATYVVRACTDPGHSVHGRGGRRPWCVEPGAGACVPEAES